MRDETFDLAFGNAGVDHRGMSRGIGVLMVLRGAMTLDLNGLSCVLKADDIVLVNDKDIYSTHAGSPNIVLILRLFLPFLKQECPEMLNYRYDCNSAAYGEHSPEKMKFFKAKRSLIRMMLARCRREDGYTLEVRSALMDLLHNIYVNFRALPTPDAREAPHDTENIRNALSFMREYYRTDVSLADAAASAGMSPQYFSKQFKQKMGIGFLEYLNGLRLDSAVYELLRTDDSILKVAVNNGFASSKPFTALFKKNYGQTPRSYRLGKPEDRAVSRDGKAKDNPGDSVPFSGVEERAGLEDLLKYVALYDIRHNSHTDPSESVSVSLLPETDGTGEKKPKKRDSLSLPRKIFKIGRLAEAMESGFREQLIAARKQLGGDYIYFLGIFGDGVAPHLKDSYFKGYDYGRLFNFFMELGLTPFVGVDLSLAPQDMEAAVSEFMRALSENSLLPRWEKKIRFEIFHSRTMDVSGFVARFRRIRSALKAFSPLIGVGFHSVSSNRSEEWARLREKLSGCKKANCSPDFLSITIDPALEESYSTFGMPPQLMKTYGVSQVEKVRSVFAEYGSVLPELFVTEWNTLSGRTMIEAFAFFRAALIASSLLSYGKNVSAAAYWLNGKSKELLTGKMDSRGLAFFVADQVKRPLYYLLHMMNKLGKNVLCREEKVVVTATGPNEYAILLSNPCYFDPRYSVEEAYAAAESAYVEVKLTGIPKGRYRFKVFFFEKKHSNAFDRWSKLGRLNFTDEDTAYYFERAILPELSIFEDDIEDDDYTIARELGYNGVALYLLKKID